MNLKIFCTNIKCVIIHSGSAIGGHYYCYRFIWNDDNTNFNI